MSDRFRKQYKFWLNLFNEQDFELSERLDGLKESRQFMRTLRKALRLYFDLQAGNTDVLEDLFPGVSNTPSEDVLSELESIKQILQAASPVRTAARSEMRVSSSPPKTIGYTPPQDRWAQAAIIERNPDGKGNGNAAHNLMASLANF